MHDDRCEFIRFETPEPNTTIGVIDSVYDPDYFKDYNRFGRSFDIIDANVGATTRHGYQILQILTHLTNDPEYHLFQVIDETGNCLDSHLMSAIGKAMEFEEVDILNMSVGTDHASNPDHNCTPRDTTCPLCEVAEEAVKQGITIVAAAGNRPQVDGVCCPSLSDHVISVGGLVTKCTADVDPDSFLRPLSKTPRPPNAYWIEREDGKGAQGNYCSNRGCIPGEACQDNQRTESWENNVDFTTKKPDVLAPVQLLTKDDTGPLIDEGTSFAVPIVSAGIACVLEGVRSKNQDLSPSEIRQAIRDSGLEFSDLDRNHFSVQSFVNKIRTRQGLPPLNIRNSPIEDIFNTID